MSVAVTINPTDVTTAANFLEQFLTDQVPDGDFSKGTALRDLTVNALAAVVAFLRADAAQIRQLQSLTSVQAATSGDETALSDAVTAILSNFFVARKNGTKARGIAVGHSTQKVDMFIPTNTTFTYSQNIVFVVDSTDTLFIPSRDLVPIIDATGAVLEYQFNIPLVAVTYGDAYNVNPDIFSGFDRFSPYVTRIDSVVAFTGGGGVESVTDLLARAPTAISVRNLINERSIAATLEDNYPDIESVLVIGMGEPEMQRDIVPTVAPNLRFHIGGAVDIYLRTALVETSYTRSVGGFFERPDGVVTMFRDASVTLTAVLPGDVIRVTAGLPIVPSEFLVTSTDGTTLMVSERSAFPIATDEGLPPTNVTYTIGRTAPEYNDVISGVGFQPYTTGTTSRQIATSGRITLPGGPVMDILDVAIVNPPPLESGFVSTLDGFIHFTDQVNTTPANIISANTPLQFQTIVHNPLYAQSALQWMELVVGPTGNVSRWDGLLLRVRYRTLQSFVDIDTFVRGARERVAAASQLPRGHHPVSISMTLTYRLKNTATALLNDTDIANTIISYINSFDAATAAIDVSSIIQLVKTSYPDIASIVPPTTGAPILTIFYTFRAPTGDVLYYETNDIVEVDETKLVSGPSISLKALGVTDQTLRYIANSTGITVKQEGA